MLAKSSKTYKERTRPANNSNISLTGFCKLNDHPSVEYRCEIPGSDGTRECQSYEPSNTIVLPKCQTPIYYSPTVLPSMKCIDGSWDYVATCVPGTVQNGTNITILIKDNVQIFISTLTYYEKPKITINNQVVNIDADPQVIDESFWRMGTVNNNDIIDINDNFKQVVPALPSEESEVVNDLKIYFPKT